MLKFKEFSVQDMFDIVGVNLNEYSTDELTEMAKEFKADFKDENIFKFASIFFFVELRMSKKHFGEWMEEIGFKKSAVTKLKNVYYKLEPQKGTLSGLYKKTLQ